jgi:myo-inositol catabolism protein IolC
MEQWLRQSNCRSIAELARDILYQEKIIWYHKDASREAIALELAMIRKELNAMGKNINQVTRYFHNTDSHDLKTAQAHKVADEFNKVGHKVELLLEMISKLTESWSPK